MCTYYWYRPRKILLSQIKKPKSCISIIVPTKSNILKFEDIIDDDFLCDETDLKWNRELFSYDNITRRKIKAQLRKNINVCEDIIGLIVEFINDNSLFVSKIWDF